jgi:hypothetical protein
VQIVPGQLVTIDVIGGPVPAFGRVSAVLDVESDSGRTLVELQDGTVGLVQYDVPSSERQPADAVVRAGGDDSPASLKNALDRYACYGAHMSLLSCTTRMPGVLT